MKLILLRPRRVNGENCDAGAEIDLLRPEALQFINSGKAIPTKEVATARTFKLDLESYSKQTLENLAATLEIEVAGMNKAEMIGEFGETPMADIAKAIDACQAKIMKSAEKKK